MDSSSKQNRWLAGFSIGLGILLYLITLSLMEPLLTSIAQGQDQHPQWSSLIQIGLYALRLGLMVLSFLLAAVLVLTSANLTQRLNGDPTNHQYLPTPDTGLHLSLHRLRYLTLLLLGPSLLAGLVGWLSQTLLGLTPHGSLTLALVTLALSLLILWQKQGLQNLFGPQDTNLVTQGATLLSYSQAQTKAKALLRQYQSQSQQTLSPAPIQWGGLPLPFDLSNQHFFIQGAPGSGKTLTLRQLTQTLLKSLRADQGFNHKGILYSKKNEDLSYLSDLLHHHKLHICTPSDQRCIKPNLALLIQDEAMALALAKSLIPIDPHSSQPYFARTAQMLLTGLIQALMYHLPKAWTLRHLLLVSETPSQIQQVLKSCPWTIRFMEQHAKPDTAEGTLQNVISELTGKLEVYRPLAAFWEQTPDSKTINLEQWVKHQESILYFGYDTKRPQVSAAAIRIFINLLAPLILAEPSNYTNPSNRYRRYFLLLDEFPSIEKIESLTELFAEGRDRGVCGVLGTQTWSQINKTYGPDEAQSLLGQIAHKIFLRPEDEVSEERTQKLFGHHETLKRNLSTSHSWQWGTSLNHSQSEQTVPLIQSSELWDLPLPSPQSGIQGFARTPGIGRYRMRAPFQPHTPDPQVSNFQPWPASRPGSLTLKPLTPEERHRLGLPQPSKEATSYPNPQPTPQGPTGTRQTPKRLRSLQANLKESQSTGTTPPASEPKTEVQPPKKRRSLILSQGWVEN